MSAPLKKHLVSGLAVQQLLKMKAKGQISLAQFLELTKEVAGTTDELRRYTKAGPFRCG